MRIGPYELASNAVLAPMAGVTDRPFRILCRQLGAGLAASEMLTADTRLWASPKSRRRMDHEGEPEPRVVQLAGSEPAVLAEAARINEALGATAVPSLTTSTGRDERWSTARETLPRKKRRTTP